MCSLLLDLEGGGARAEGVTLLPPGAEWLEKALRSFGAPGLSASEPDAQLAPRDADLAAAIAAACANIGEAMAYQPHITAMLDALFGFEASPPPRSPAAAAAALAAADAVGRGSQGAARSSAPRGPSTSVAGTPRDGRGADGINLLVLLPDTRDGRTRVNLLSLACHHHPQTLLPAPAARSPTSTGSSKARRRPRSSPRRSPRRVLRARHPPLPSPPYLRRAPSRLSSPSRPTRAVFSPPSVLSSSKKT